MAKRAFTVQQILEYEPDVIELEEKFRLAIGNPEVKGTWIIWGGSGNGKTRFALQLAKCLARHRKVLYNSLEEGLSQSYKIAVASTGMVDVSRNFTLLDKESIPDLIERLKNQRSADIVIIDSLQFTGLNYESYKALKTQFPRKLFIFISHAEGREPKNETAKSVKFDANVKIYVESYKAYTQSRYGGGAEYVIWEKGTRKL